MGSFLRTGPDSKGAASYALERERERIFPHNKAWSPEVLTDPSARDREKDRNGES